MTGHEVLWIPGTDHAAIATENVVIKHLKIKSREELSRENFLKECKKFAAEKHERITHQIKQMGAWLDWSREVYTFDEPRNHAVNTIFKDLYKDGLITRGHRMINWSTGAQSVLADEELEWEDRKEPFYYIKCGQFIIGTARSETKCSNSPVILNPNGDYIKIKSKKSEETLILSKHAWEKDPILENLKTQYKATETIKGRDLVDQKFEYETYAGKRKFWTIADNLIDMEKGTGAMTISAAHSEDDYELATRLNLKELFFQKIDKNGKMTEIAGECQGLSVKAARKKSAEIMQEKDLLIAENKNYTHRVPLCYRSNCVIEPMISQQWFISVEKEFTDKWTNKKTTLKKLAQEAVRDNHTKIIPHTFEKTYFQWIDNLRDWCISRQIWWGHQIPVWYDKEGKIHLQPGKDLTQDQDTLDTWFSSALWPMSPLGYPDTENPDFKKFYPTDVLETGHDILFFWVARMILFGRYSTGKYPFHTTYLHGMVCDEHGKKMSKSKGNGIDPLDMITEYGADAVRLALVIGTTPGNSIPIGKQKIGGYRNFVNKLWNAGRFVKMQLEPESDTAPCHLQDFDKSNIEPKSLADKWIATKFTKLTAEINTHLENYQISQAGDKIYHFIWNEFCDWYLEAQKADPNPEFLAWLYFEILTLAHPLCPFITETLYQEFWGKTESLMNRNYPKPNFKNPAAEATFEELKEIITAIRKTRADKKINPKEKIDAKIKTKNKEIQNNKKIIQTLANLNKCEVGESIKPTKDEIKILAAGTEIYINIPFDEAAEKARITQETANLKKQIQTLKARLQNKAYTEKAPPALVNQTKEELKNSEEALKKLT